jgi:hypothetical protein
MIGTIRKHSTWMWGIIIVVVIFTFVIWGTNTGRQGGPSRTGIYGRINGQPVSEEQVVAARNEVNLRYFLRFGEWPDADAERMGFDLQREIYTLLLVLQKLEEHKMFAGTEAKAVVAANILSSLQKQGIKSLAEFEQALLRPQGLTLTDLDRFIGHQIALQQLTAVEGLPGQLIATQQIESLWRRENEEISAQVVFFSAVDQQDAVSVTPEALATYFTNQMARYRVPERVQVTYVAYPVSNYFAQADERLAGMTNLNARIDNFYAQGGSTNYPGLTPEEAKQKIREEMRREAAVFAARQDAATFADELWRQEPLKSANLESTASQKGLTARVTEPFDRASTPAGLDVDSTFTQAAFRLRDDEPFAGPIAGEDHLYVIALNRRLPSENANFEQVKAQVTADYRLQQATELARQAGRVFAESLTNRLATGEAFTEVATKAGYKPILLPPFSRSTPSLPEVEQKVSLGFLKQAAFDTPVGSASGFNFTSDGGYLVYVASRLPLDEVKMKEELPRYTRLVRQTLENDAFNAWFSQEAQVGLRDTPLGQTPPPQVGPPAAQGGS